MNRPPEIDMTSVQMEVDEEVENGTLVGRINISDPDNTELELDNRINTLLADPVLTHLQSHSFYTHNSQGIFPLTLRKKYRGLHVYK